MKQIQINQQLSISDQITLEEVSELAHQGIKTLICNRPDGEEPNQLAASQIQAAALEMGMKFINIPVPGRVIPENSLNEFIEALKNTDDKIHAYCRTGTRCSIFWGLKEAKQKSVNEVLGEAQSLGFDLSAVTDQLETVHQSN
jgi:sulfide:quinone oxidoreductase